MQKIKNGSSQGEVLNHEEELKQQIMRGSGELATLMRALDWSRLPTGPLSNWSEALRTSVSICLGSRHAIEIWWGPEYIRFYNDAYRPILGAAKHPQFIGRPGQEMWAEIWDVIEPLLRHVRETGEAIWHENFQLFVMRNGYLEETYFNFSYGPVFEHGQVAGIFSPCTETTPHVLQDRRLRLLRQLSVEGTAETITEALNTCTRLTAEDNLDVPFSLLYVIDAAAHTATLASSSGLVDPAANFPRRIHLNHADSPFGDIGTLQSSVLIDDLEARFGAIAAGPWGEAHSRAAILPLRGASGEALIGFLVAGVSARLPYTDEYRVFFDLLAAQISNVIARTATLLEERKRAENFAAMFNEAPAFIAVLRGPQHVFEFANPRYKELVGRIDVVDKPVAAALPEIASQGFIDILDNVFLTGQVFHADSLKVSLQRAPDTDPETRYLTFVYKPLTDSDGRISGIFVLGSDVTENVAAHEALRRSEKLSAAGRLAATIAHEVNNPLEAMTNLLYLARDGASAESLRYIDIAEEELARIAHITKQTLAFYKETTAPTLFDLSSTVEQTVMFYQRQASSRGIELQTEITPGANLIGVEGEIKQVLSNLISNAIDAFGGDPGRICIRTSTRQNRVALVVSDTGRGIPPNALARIWEPFFTTKATVGTGLGLWVTREILNKHKATLRLRTVHTGPRHGTTFRIVFPTV